MPITYAAALAAAGGNHNLTNGQTMVQPGVGQSAQSPKISSTSIIPTTKPLKSSTTAIVPVPKVKCYVCKYYYDVLMFELFYTHTNKKL